MSLLYKIVILSAVLSYVALSHECHHEPNYNLRTVQDEVSSQLNIDPEKRNLQSSKFRMTYDTTQIQATVTNQSHLSLLMRTLDIAKIFYVNLMVPVNAFQGKITPINDVNCPYTFSAAQLLEQITNTDFHFYIQSQTPPSDQTWIAKSSACLTQQLDNRTIMGIITINLNYLSKMSTSNYDFQNYVDVFIHEMFHSLIFSQGLFPLFINPSTGQKYTNQVDYNTQAANGAYFIAFPKSVAWAKTYFNCDSITSVPLENNGSEGSAGGHWERTILQNDIMTASSLAGDNLWSGLNNALIEDSGWYTLRTDSGTFALSDKMVWGKGKGCDFYNNRCSTNKYPEFCTTLKENGNTYSYSGLGFCSNLDTYSQCPYMAPYKNQLCFNENNKFDADLGAPLYGKYFSVFDATSRSFKSNLSPNYVEQLADYFAVCYPYTCSSDNLSIKITVGPKQLTCNQNSQVISSVDGFNGSLTCPSNISTFCSEFVSCPDFCSQRGYCISGKCRCVSGITGLNETNCECSDGYYVNDTNKACETCGISNCLRCTSANSCSKCKTGYYYSNNQCIQCKGNCLDCDSTGSCTKCEFGYLQLDAKEGCTTVVQTFGSILSSISILISVIFIML